MTDANKSEQIVLLPPNQTLYFNGFSMAIGTGDLVCTLLRNGAPVLTLNASYTVAKTLAEALTATIQKLEEKTGREIMTVNTVVDATK
jgi:histidinol-phosphate/aromatic aminotransferase/cobyric acid decarboxylase-like protein